MPVTDTLLANNARYVESFHEDHHPVRPRLKLAVITCMDSRIDVFAALGLEIGDAHILRNAGGVVTESELRSLALSQRKMGTEEVLLIHHTDCGAHGLDDDALAGEIEADVGYRPTWPRTSFTDLDEDVRVSIARVRHCPFLTHREHVRGFVFDVDTGALREVV